MVVYGFLAYVVNIRDEKKGTLTDVPIVCEFPDAFPEDLPSVSPKRQVEFRIYQVSGMEHVTKAPYRRAPLKIHELSKQLQELMKKVDYAK